MKTTKCPYCGKPIGNSGYPVHVKVCERKHREQELAMEDPEPMGNQESQDNSLPGLGSLAQYLPIIKGMMADEVTRQISPLVESINGKLGDMQSTILQNVQGEMAKGLSEVVEEMKTEIRAKMSQPQETPAMIAPQINVPETSRDNGQSVKPGFLQTATMDNLLDVIKLIKGGNDDIDGDAIDRIIAQKQKMDMLFPGSPVDPGQLATAMFTGAVKGLELGAKMKSGGATANPLATRQSHERVSLSSGKRPGSTLANLIKRA